MRVALDVDAGLRIGRQHVGPEAVAALRHPRRRRAGPHGAATAPGFHLVGVMTYEGQVAGVPDDVPEQRARSLVVRRLKAASAGPAGRPPPRARRRARAGWSSSSSGTPAGRDPSRRRPPTRSSPRSPPGSGLLVPALFDHYRSFEPRPAAYFGLPVTRRPSPQVATVARRRLRRLRPGRRRPAADRRGRRPACT